MKQYLQELRNIQHPRHPGVSAGVCAACVEATDVCMSRHHTPPETALHIEREGARVSRILRWQQPTPDVSRAWNNADDATRDAAYIVSLAVAEDELEMVAFSRAETRTGADYYIGPSEAADLEDAWRLEVSGSDRGSRSQIRRRLTEKIKQAVKGLSNLPALAAVVGFREALVMMSEVVLPDG